MAEWNDRRSSTAAMVRTCPLRLVVAEGDLVALHTHQARPGDDRYVTMDFFGFDAGGKIVERWDAIQSAPAQTRNGRSMY